MDFYELLGSGVVLLLAGFLAGFLGGMIGAGGGLIVVPVLYHTFFVLGVDPSIRMHLAIGTALAAVIPTSMIGARSHWLRGNVDLSIVKRLAPPVLLSSVLAGTVSGRLDSKELGIVFALLAILLSINIALKKAFTLGDGLPGILGSNLLGAGIGFLSTLIGIGGATLTVPLLHAYRVPMPIAIGTASTLGAMVGLPGAIAFMSNGWGDPRLPLGSMGYVNLMAVAIIFPASAIAISLGAKVTHLINERMLRSLFAIFLIFSALRMIFALP
jgi:uncharacterized protein